MRRLLTLTGALAAAAIFAPTAFAHANVVGATPPDGTTLAEPPAAVRIRFDDPVRLGGDNAVVANSGGSVLRGDARLAERRHVLVLPLRSGLADGDYSARWGIVSDDGHLESGVLAFRVGAARAEPPRSVLDADGGPGALEAIARWLYLAGILVAGGTTLFRLLVSDAGPRRAGTTLVLALVAVVAGGSVLLETTDAGGTRFGDVTELAVVVAALAAAAAAAAPLEPRLLLVAGAGSLSLLLAPSLGGHALDDGGWRTLAAVLDVAHVEAAAFWIGGALQLALLPAGERAAAASRFSRLVLGAVALVVLSGIGRALRELDGVSQLWSTGYGRTILAKSALLVAVVAVASVSRSRVAAAARLVRPVIAELAVLALLVGAAALLTALRPGRDANAATPASAVLAREVAAPARPPTGSVVFASASKRLAVALAVRPGTPLRLTATVIGGTGKGVDGLDVAFTAAGSGSAARACGHGCYAATLPLPSTRRVGVRIAGAGAPRTVAFALPESWPPGPGTAFLRRATSAFRGLRTAVFEERLSSGRGTTLRTTWKLAAPDRLEYAIRGGAGGIVIGEQRWDRAKPGGTWTRSPTTRLPQPFPPWGSRIENARVLERHAGRVTLSWLDPGVPAWFTGTFDTRTALPVELRMTAAAHFMRHRYLAFDGNVRIEPPKD